MTERQRRFVDAYIETGNATQAAIRAGYAENSADVTAAKLLGNTRIFSEIQRRLNEVRTNRTATLQECLDIVTAILRGETTEKTAVSIGVGKGAKVEIVETPPKIRDRLKAAEYLLKVHGAFRENQSAETPAEIRVIRKETTTDD